MARAARLISVAALGALALAAPLAARSHDGARKAMVAAIRASVHRASPDADNAELARVLAVMAEVPREAFVPAAERRQALADLSQPIGDGQTISAPSIVAVMTAAAALPPHANVLDVGTGSGYQAAVLSPLAKSVTSIEIVKPLADQARVRLAAMGYRNVTVIAGDGFAGASDRGPFDGIVVAAGASEIPAPLIAQLKVGGRIVMPIGPGTFQEQLVVGIRQPDGALQRCTLGVTGFVPLTGRGARPTAMHGLTDRSIPFCYGAALT